jgi:hypothetical protein
VYGIWNGLGGAPNGQKVSLAPSSFRFCRFVRASNHGITVQPKNNMRMTKAIDNLVVCFMLLIDDIVAV